MGIFQQFPYSNFHEMNLDQIIKIMREMQDEWENTKTEWASYKEFIDNYFENLNLDAETERALRRLVEDGTLDPVIDPVIAAETAAWLAAHITQPTTPPLDTSLTVAGAAADAKAAGDVIRTVENDVDNVNMAFLTAADTGLSISRDLYTEDNITWIQGSWTSSGDVASNYWIRSGLIDGDFVLHNSNTEYGYIVGKFTDGGTFSGYIIGGDGLDASEYIYVPDVGAGYKVKIRSRFVDDASTLYTPSEATAKIFRDSNILKYVQRAPKYDGFITDHVADYSNLLANISGVAGNIIFNVTSAWTDKPFNGFILNQQYTLNYDIQVMFCLTDKKIAYRFVNRNTQTPYTDWQIIPGGGLYGKTVSIIGDSRSSYSGTVPAGNAYYYPKSTGAVLTSLSQMWWKKVIDYFGMTLVVNDSYSGGYVANMAGEPAAKILSSDTAINNLGNTAPDIILVFAGVNDWNGDAVNIGTYDGNGTFPASNNNFREAMAIMLSKVQSKFPDADIWLCTNPYCCPAGTGSVISSMPVPNTPTGVSLDTFNDAIKDMADIFGCGIIDFTQCGTNWGNLITYTGDYNTDNGLHYNAAGHALLAEVAINTLRAYYD